MAYRSAPESSVVVSRRLRVPDSLRWMKLVLGLVMAAMALFFLWSDRWSSLECRGDACVLRLEYVLRPTEELRFDARHAPAVVVEPAKMGKNGRGKRLLLRYESGAVVELARDWGDGVEAKAKALRAYLAAPSGFFVVREPHATFPMVIMFIVTALGIAMFLDGAGLLGWRRLRADRSRRALEIDLMMLGFRVKRATFPIGAATTVGRAPVREDNPRLHWLTLESPGASPARLPLLDTPSSRASVDEMLSLLFSVASEPPPSRARAVRARGA